MKEHQTNPNIQGHPIKQLAGTCQERQRKAERSFQVKGKKRDLAIQCYA